MTNSYIEAPKVRLGDITTKIGSGATPRGGKESYKPHGISLIRSMNVHDSTFDYADLAHLDEKQARSLDNVTVEENDVLLNITGASVARCCMVPKNVLPARVNQHVSIVRPDKKKANPFYIYYCLVSPHYKDHLLSIAQGGATREALTKEKIEDFEISLPPLLTQRKIAAILSAYDGLIENNTRRIKILEEMAQAIYREWFVHFRFPGHEKVKMVTSPLGPIPQGWSLKRIDEVVSLTRHGIRPSDFAEEIFAHFSIPAYDDGKMPKMEFGASIRSGKYEVPDGCVLLSKLNPRIPRVWMPTLGGTSRAIASTEFLALTPKLPVTPSYLYCLCSSPEFSDAYAARALGTSTSHQRVKPDDFLNTLGVFPPESLVRRFSDLVAPMLAATHSIRGKNANLSQTRDLLLPKLISGEVDVSELDIAVPEEATC